MRYEAIFVSDGVDALPYEIIKKPESQVYVADFGRQKGDICHVAESGEQTSLSVQEKKYAIRSY